MPNCWQRYKRHNVGIVHFIGWNKLRNIVKCNYSVWIGKAHQKRLNVELEFNGIGVGPDRDDDVATSAPPNKLVRLLRSDTCTWISLHSRIFPRRIYCRLGNLLRLHSIRRLSAPARTWWATCNVHVPPFIFWGPREICKCEMRKLCRSVIIAICSKENRASSARASEKYPHIWIMDFMHLQ